MFYLSTIRESVNSNSSGYSNIQPDELSINDMISKLHPEAQKLVNDLNRSFLWGYQAVAMKTRY